jgi:hypothetical protein
MNWLGPKSGGAAVLEAPASVTNRREGQRERRPDAGPDARDRVRDGVRDGKAGRTWLPTFRHRRAEPAAIAVPAGPAFAEIASEAVASFRSQAIGMRCGSGRDAAARVRVVCSSAAHITDPSQLEVWVLLGDVAEERVPPRWDPTEVIADVQLTDWVLQLRAAALGHLMALDWPDVDRVVVRIDAADRVERRGGWDYVVSHAD